jgi:hypothetical protein
MFVVLLACQPTPTTPDSPTPPSPTSTSSSLPADEEFLNQLAEDTWLYLSSDWARANHMPWSWRSEAASGGDFANTTEIGLLALSWIGAYEMKAEWSPDWNEVETEVIVIMDQLEAWQSETQASQPNGSNAFNKSVFYQWYWINWNPPVVGGGEIDHVVPSIDNAFLAASLITIREYCELNNHSVLAQKADNILRDMNFRLWYDESQSMFRLGDTNNPKGGVWADYYSNENRIVNFVARSLNQLSIEEFQTSLNTLTQNSAIYDRGTSDTSDDITVDKVAWDGSYFTYVAPALFIREVETLYGDSTIIPATEAQIAYAEDMGYKAWGLSDSYDLGLEGYIQQGALPTGMSASPETRLGLITPHASALALITPLDSTAATNLETISTTFPSLYEQGRGFRDSVIADPTSPDFGKTSDRFSALAQEWLFLSIVNDKTGFIWSYFYKDEGVAQAHLEMVEVVK